MAQADISRHDDAPRAEEGHAGTGHAIDTLKVCITAEEAYPALERAFLEATDTVTCSFRIFDLRTKLHSPEARKIGESWFDLFVHCLDRGVRIRLIITDFDPVAAPDLHRKTCRTRRQVCAVRELAQPGCDLTFTASLHDAKVGPLPCLFFRPLINRKLREIRDSWAKLPSDSRAPFLAEMPRLAGIAEPCAETDTLKTYPSRVTLFPATHHQKMAVFDDRLLSVGGLDVNDRRYDTKRHDRPAARTWHDVQVFCTGPVVAAARAHLDSFLDVTAGRAAPPEINPAFLRTLSRPRSRNFARVSPMNVCDELRQTHLSEIDRSERLIYLETQFLRHVPLARALARRARDCPGLKLILILPAAPEDVAFDPHYGLDARYGEHLQLRCLTMITRAFGPDRLIVSSPVQPRRRESDGRDTLHDAPLIYVHSKVSIFDNRAAVLSSANLNGRSLCWDTEAGVHITRPEQIDQLRRRCMGHWLPDALEGRKSYLAPDTAFDLWQRLINDNSTLPPHARSGFLVRYDSDAAREAAQPLPGFSEEIV